MLFSSSLAYLSIVATSFALVPVPIENRAVGSSCTTPHGSGTCQKTSNCASQGFHLKNYCPHDANDVQCCVKKTCKTSSGSGICMNTSDKCGGSFVAGACPGTSSIQCCVSSSHPPSPPAAPKGNGAAVVQAALKEKGLPYGWGQGGCDGPTKGGGFDCSGLTQYAICQATSKKTVIPRTAHTQYHSSLGKHLPRAHAEPGDLIFWAQGTDCTKDHIAHVGIYMSPGHMVNAAHKGVPVREQSIWTEDNGEHICPDAVRFV